MKKLWIGMMLMLAAWVGTAQGAMLAEFTFDTDTTDTAGGYDGILGGGATVTNGVLVLDNGGFMDLAAAFSAVNPFDGSGDFTIQMDYKATTGNTLISSARDNLPENHSMAVYAFDRRGTKYVRHDNYYVGAVTVVGGAWDGEWHSLLVTYEAATTTIEITIDDASQAGTLNPAIPGIENDTVRIGGTLNTTFPPAVLNNVLTVDNVRIYDTITGPAELIVDPASLDIVHTLPGDTSAGSVDVSYYSLTNMDINISISNATVSGAFSVLSATNQTLTDPYPATTALDFQFDNTVAGLVAGESATGLVTIAWSEQGAGGTNGTVQVPIYATAVAPEVNVDPTSLEIVHVLTNDTSTSSVDVTYLSTTNVDITISISDEEDPGAFDVLSATSQTLTNAPDATTLEFEFDNSVAGLAHGETSTGLVTIAWSEQGAGGASGTVLVPISARGQRTPSGTLYFEQFNTDPGFSQANAIGVELDTNLTYFTYGEYAGSGSIGETTHTGVLHLDSNTTGSSARSRGLLTVIDTSDAVPGTWTVSFEVTNWVAGIGTVGFKVSEGSGLATNYLRFDYGDNNGAGDVPRKNGGDATWTDIASTWGTGTPGTGIVTNGTVRFDFTLTEAGEPGDYLALSWTQVRSTSTAPAPKLDIDNVWVGVGDPPMGGGPQTDPVITGFSVSGSDVTLTWTADNNGTYSIQRKTSLQSPSWTDVMTGLPAGGGTTNVPVSGASQEFYQIYGE